MKRLSIAALLLVLISVIWYCKKDNNSSSAGGFPQNIIVNLPSAISGSSNTDKSMEVLSGGCVPFAANSVYKMVRLFIYIGESSAIFVQDIITAIGIYDLSKPQTIVYKSKDDGNYKKIVVVQGGTFNNVSYDMKLTITDSLTGNKAMQVYWYKSKMQGIAIVSPHACNAKDSFGNQNPAAIYMVQYNGMSNSVFDNDMVVSIAGLTVNPADTFAVKSLKMEAYKKGNIVTLRGNSIHPNAMFIINRQNGFSYSFVAKGDEQNNLGVINLALPSTVFDSSNVFANYSVQTVMTNEIDAAVTKYLGISNPSSNPIIAACIDSMVVNLASPAFYTSSGFVSCGSKVPAGYNY